MKIQFWKILLITGHKTDLLNILLGIIIWSGALSLLSQSSSHYSCKQHHNIVTIATSIKTDYWQERQSVCWWIADKGHSATYLANQGSQFSRNWWSSYAEYGVCMGRLTPVPSSSLMLNDNLGTLVLTRHTIIMSSRENFSLVWCLVYFSVAEGLLMLATGILNAGEKEERHNYCWPPDTHWQWI